MVKIEFDEEDKKVLEKCVFVVQNGIISFPQGASYNIERLEKIIKEAKKMKSKKNQIMCGLFLQFPYTRTRKKQKPRLKKDN